MGKRYAGGKHASSRGRRRRKKKIDPKGIYEILGIALGCIGLSYDDFCRLEYKEFAAVWKAYAEQRDTDFKDRWQRTRILAAIVIQPHLGKRRKVTPEELLPFPWDKESKKKGDAPKLTKEEQRRRMEELVKKLGDDLI